jgi:hypothetical protein
MGLAQVFLEATYYKGRQGKARQGKARQVESTSVFYLGESMIGGCPSIARARSRFA